MKAKRLLALLVALVLAISTVGMMQISVFADDAAALTWSQIANDQIKSDVTKNLTLPQTVAVGGNTCNVSWESSNEAVISNTGVVTRDLAAKDVTLTAKFGSTVKTFDIVVPGISEGKTSKTINFDDYAVGALANAEVDGVTESKPHVNKTDASVLASWEMNDASSPNAEANVNGITVSNVSAISSCSPKEVDGVTYSYQYGSGDIGYFIEKAGDKDAIKMFTYIYANKTPAAVTTNSYRFEVTPGIFTDQDKNFDVEVELYIPTGTATQYVAFYSYDLNGENVQTKKLEGDAFTNSVGKWSTWKFSVTGRCFSKTFKESIMNRNFKIATSGKGSCVYIRSVKIRPSQNTTNYDGYVVSEDLIEGGNNKAIRVNHLFTRRKITATEISELKDKNNTIEANNKTYYLNETEPLTAYDGRRFFTAHRSDRTDYWTWLYVVKQDGNWVADSTQNYTYPVDFYADGSPCDYSTYSNKTNYLTVAAPAEADFDDGIYTMSFRYGAAGSGQLLRFYDGTKHMYMMYYNATDGYVQTHDSLRPHLRYDASTTQVADDVKTYLVGKSYDTPGVVSDSEKDTYIEKIGAINIGEWIDIKFVYDLNNKTSRMYRNGKPVYWPVTVGGVTKYCCDTEIRETALPYLRFYQDLGATQGSETLLDDIKMSYTTSQEAADAIIASLDFSNLPAVESGIALNNANNAITYTSPDSKFNVNGNVITPVAQVGNATVTGQIKATATVNGQTAEKTFNLTIKQQDSYVVNSVVLKKDGVRVYTPCDGAVIEKINISENADKNASAYIAIYEATGALSNCAVKPISANGDVNVGLTLSEGDTYKVFVFDGALAPCTFATEALADVSGTVNMYVVGDGAAKAFAPALEGLLNNVTVNIAGAIAGNDTMTVFKAGSFGSIKGAAAGDYVIISLGINDAKAATAAEYKATLVQMATTAKRAGLIPVMVSTTANAAYKTAMEEAAAACGAAYIVADETLAKDTAIPEDKVNTIAAQIANQFKVVKLPIAAYVK